MSRRTNIILLIVFLFTMTSACGKSDFSNNNTVAVYTSVDQVYSEPIFKDFEQKTGIKVLAVYDVEATKSTGLTNRLIAENNRPQADVYWNNEIANIILLKNKGVLTKYISPSASDIPKQFLDTEGFWSGFGGRARVILVNTDLVDPKDYPKSINDIFDNKYPGAKIGISSPVFGTTATFAAAIYSLYGTEKGKDFFEKIRDKNIQVFQGNSVVKDMVASGRIMFGLTDSDDAYASISKGDNVDIVIPDQGENDIGTLVIPNTAALIANSPHPEQGKKFLDYLLSKEVEGKLLEESFIDITVRDLDIKPKTEKYQNMRTMDIDFNEVYLQMETAKKDMTELFVN